MDCRIRGFYCIVCPMYARLEQEFQSEYRYGKCEHVAILEAHIKYLEEQNATLRVIGELERNMLFTKQTVSGVDIVGGAMNQKDKVDSWVNVVRGSKKGSKKRKATPVSVLPSNIAKLSDNARASVMAILAVTALPDSWENSPASSRRLEM